MKINQVEFNDWRYFIGKQTIQFATDHGKSVTAVWGANSSGKTTILNGILWALWGTLTEDFQRPEILVNDTATSNAKEGETLSAYVEVKFEHGGNRYTMKRWCSQKKSDREVFESMETHASLRMVDKKGETFSYLDEEAFSEIDQILPKVLSTYFFFNGEKFKQTIETVQGKKLFADAVRQVIGLTKYERALKHIIRTKAELDSRISNSEKSAEIDQLQIRQTQAVLSQKGLEDRLTQIEDDLARLGARFDKIAIEQSAFHEVKELILERQGVITQLDLRKASQKYLKDSRTELIGGLYTSQVLAGISIDITNLAEGHRRQKHIPADFKQSFINDLLTSGICICGCELKTNSDQFKKVQSRLNEGALEGTEESWTKLAVDVAGIDSQFTSLKQMFNELSGKIDSEEQAINDLSGKLSKFDDSIATVAAGTNAGEAIVALESERNSVLAESLELTRKREQKLELLNACKKEIADCDREMRKLKPKNEEAKLHLKRRNYLSLVQELVEDEFVRLKESLREDLEMSITTMFRSLSNNLYFAELDKDFGLRLCVKDDAGNNQQVALGTGETQLMYYSFIAALSQLNFEKSQKSINIHQSFPILIDAPFSYLDSELSTRVARNLPAVTHQVVFLNFKRELPTMLEIEVANAVGKVSILKFHVGKDPAILPNANESIELPQGSFDYVVAQENIKRFTEIVSVTL